MNFTETTNLGSRVWISGIYKVVEYAPLNKHERTEYQAYFIQECQRNWGDRVEKNIKLPFDFYQTPEEAKAACERHAKTYTPSSKTAKRAAEILADMMAEEAA